MKKRKGDPWIPNDAYGRLLPPFSMILVVREIERSLVFYREVLAAFVHYSDEDFAAVKVGGTEIMIHADHTYEGTPLYARLSEAGGVRGAGVELRLFGTDPDALEKRAEAAGALVVKPTRMTGHGWREVMVADPDGYVWAVGMPTEAAS
jgi:uncharacterized glyoxalase superfamily protein PhnB